MGRACLTLPLVPTSVVALDTAFRIVSSVAFAIAWNGTLIRDSSASKAFQTSACSCFLKVVENPITQSPLDAVILIDELQPCRGARTVNHIVPALVPGGRIAVTPVRTGPSAICWGSTPSIRVTCPTRTPSTSVIALLGPVSYSPIRIPDSRARGRSDVLIVPPVVIGQIG